MARKPCKATNRQGEQCGADPRFVDQEKELCPAHDPDKKEEMQERAKKGGDALAKKYKMDGISEDELPPLNSHEHAQRWLEVIGRAIGTGRLGDREGQAMIRAVSEWVKTEAEKVTSKELEDLQQQLNEVREELGQPDWA